MTLMSLTTLKKSPSKLEGDKCKSESSLFSVVWDAPKEQK